MESGNYLSNILRKFILTILTLLSFYLGKSQDDVLYSSSEYNEQVTKASYYKPRNTDSALVIYKKLYKDMMEIGDTSRAITNLLTLSEIYIERANYGKAYEGFWKALLYSEKIDDKFSMAKSYSSIGVLYELYMRYDLAMFYHQKALTINKQLIKDDKIGEHEILHNYFGLIICNRKLGDLKTTRLYIDSCRLTLNESVNTEFISDNAFIRSEYAFIEHLEGNHELAIEIINVISPYFELSQPSYLVIVYSFLGDAYKDLGNYKASEKAYLASLKRADTHISHIDYKISVYQKLSELYEMQEKYVLSLECLKKSNTIKEELFGARSKNNIRLLEIQDNYRIEKEEQEKLMREKRLAELEHEENVWFLKSIILVGSIATLLLFGLLYFRFLRIRYRSSKHKIELEVQKAREILKIKNKELASSTLQIIEKEELLSEVKSKLNELKRNPKARELDILSKTIHASSNASWDEFEARFTAVNDSFYGKLAEKFPQLSQGDHRLCALIKLNFSSKEMSKLLGISVESVHSARYKIRKKLRLSRDVNLTEYIAKI